jgi:hypothetical protein
MQLPQPPGFDCTNNFNVDLLTKKYLKIQNYGTE